MAETTQVAVVTIHIDESREITLAPETVTAKSFSSVQWIVELAPGVLEPLIFVKPLDTAKLVPDPALPWDDENGMGFADDVAPKAQAEKDPGASETVQYVVTAVFPDGVTRTMIGSVLIVDP